MNEAAVGGMTSVLNALRILEEVAARQPVGVSELSRATGFPKSSVQRAVGTLRVAGWLRPVGDELTRWMLTTRILSIGLSAFGEYDLRDAALPIMEELRDETGETVHLMILEGEDGVILERVDSPQAVRTFVRLGARTPLHATSTGKAVLAQLARPELDELLSKELARYTTNTIVDPMRLRKELQAVRKKGYSVNMCEWRPEVAAVGAAILSLGGRPVGALTISMPFSRFREELVPRFGELVANATRRLGRDLRRP